MFIWTYPNQHLIYVNLDLRPVGPLWLVDLDVQGTPFGLLSLPPISLKIILKVVWHDILLFWNILLINAYMNLHYAVSKVWSLNFTQFGFLTLFGKKCVVFQARGSNSTYFCQAQGFNSTFSCWARSSPTRTCAIQTSSLTKTCAIKTSSLTKHVLLEPWARITTHFSRKVP